MFAGAIRGLRRRGCCGVFGRPFVGFLRCGVPVLAVSCARLGVLFLLGCLASGCVGLPVRVVRWLPCRRLRRAGFFVLCLSVASVRCRLGGGGCSSVEGAFFLCYLIGAENGIRIQFLALRLRTHLVAAGGDPAHPCLAASGAFVYLVRHLPHPHGRPCLPTQAATCLRHPWLRHLPQGKNKFRGMLHKKELDLIKKSLS